MPFPAFLPRMTRHYAPFLRDLLEGTIPLGKPTRPFLAEGPNGANFMPGGSVNNLRGLWDDVMAPGELDAGVDAIRRGGRPTRNYMQETPGGPRFPLADYAVSRPPKTSPGALAPGETRTWADGLRIHREFPMKERLGSNLEGIDWELDNFSVTNAQGGAWNFSLLLDEPADFRGLIPDLPAPGPPTHVSLDITHFDPITRQYNYREPPAGTGLTVSQMLRVTREMRNAYPTVTQVTPSPLSQRGFNNKGTDMWFRRPPRGQ